ncbi:hypothetical protein [Streptomyces xantholiticus]|uniref:Secreted protein n=1 Tax=Streptomyces xantholiticus TaxID=68285 RepID=A0ABV1UVX9_9ACTN
MSALGGNSLSCLLLQSAVASRSFLPVLMRRLGCDAAAELLLCLDPRRIHTERLHTCPEPDHSSTNTADRLGTVSVDALLEGRELGAHPRQQLDLHGNGGHLHVSVMATDGTCERRGSDRLPCLALRRLGRLHGLLVCLFGNETPTCAASWRIGGRPRHGGFGRGLRTGA